jgi:hypothetical protein
MANLPTPTLKPPPLPLLTLTQIKDLSGKNTDAYKQLTDYSNKGDYKGL